MKKINKLAYFLITFSFLTYLNFYVSNLIFYKLAHGWRFSNPLINIIYTENTGAAFSIMQNLTGPLIVLSVIAFIAIIYYLGKNLEEISLTSIFFIAILLSGILGNLYERAFLGYVRDFFDLAFVHFPIFNISDIFINIGVIGIIIIILLTKKTIKFL